MSASTLGALLLWLIAFAAIIAGAVYLLQWLYHRSTKETSFVRTGFGGQTAVIGGGAFVIPILHEVTPVSMRTLRLEVRRAREQALITRDRMRVDVVAEFYVRVAPRPDAVAAAAQTLGRRTTDPEALRELVEGRFVDALRSVAAEMTMEEMHEQRGDYVRRVKATVAEALSLNGLDLEAVSLTGLDQTSMEYFNPSNAFDAEGLTRLTEQIERRKKIRNDIEQDTLVQIRNKNLEAEKLQLTIDRDAEYARLAQEREVEVQRAAQRAELARERAERERESEQAQIRAREQVELARIAQERALEAERIAREQEIQRLEVERRRLLELAEQERAIAVAKQSRAQSEAQAEAERARAEAVAAEERVFTAREAEIAERRKQVELIEAAQRAEAQRVHADAEAEADKVRALASRLRYEIEAEGARLMNEAQNMLSPESRASTMRLRLIEKLDAIIRESVKPMERIEGIKILQVEGLGGTPRGTASEGGTIADSVVNSALRYRAQAPLIDNLLKEIGISAGSLAGLSAPLAAPANETGPRAAE
jgi:uncharacterized membrane protein YqiK